ncbi:MAG: ABC transporter substrate-binding protein, partial [Armatimonadota bacterium]
MANSGEQVHPKEGDKTMTKRNLWLIIGAVIIIAAIIVGIRLTQKPAPKEQIIKIGAILPLTGPAGVLGESVMAGMKLATEDFNAKYATHYFLDFQDTQGNPKQAVDIYQRSKAIYSTPIVLSWMSHTASALLELTESDKTVLFMGAAKSSLTDGNKFAIRVFPNAKDLAQIAAQFIGRMQVKTVGIYYINDDYGRDVG